MRIVHCKAFTPIFLGAFMLLLPVLGSANFPGNQFTEVLIAGSSTQLDGSDYVPLTPCGVGNVQYRWSAGGTVVQNWSNINLFISPASSVSYTVEGRCTSTQQPIGSALVNVLVNSTLGAANLSKNANGDLVVSNIGSTGNDGVSIEMAFPVRWDVIWEDLGTAAELSTGAAVTTTMRGTVNGISDQVIGFTHAEDVGDSVEFSADFSAIGANSVTLLVYDGGPTGTLVASASGQPNPLFKGIKIKRDSHIRPGTINLDITITRSRIAVVGGPEVDADYICVVPENPTASVGEVSRATITAKSISTLTITDQVYVSEGSSPPATVPTWSRWGMLATVVLLVGGGATVIVWRNL